MEKQIKSLMSAVSTLVALQIFTLSMLVGGGFYVVHELKEEMSSLESVRPAVPENVDEWQKLAREHNASQGASDAKVVLIEFSDFQCPYCKRFTDETREELVALYGDDVRMVFKHVPLERIHPQAMNAAIAAQCARREGKFWEAHARFFAEPDALSVENLISIGESLGLGGRYADCISNEETRHEVEQDMQDAAQIGIQGTPTFVINGKVLVGAQSAAAFKAAFEQARLSHD